MDRVVIRNQFRTSESNLFTTVPQFASSVLEKRIHLIFQEQKEMESKMKVAARGGIYILNFKTSLRHVSLVLPSTFLRNKKRS